MRTVFFAKKVDDDDYVIDIFDVIGSDFWSEGVTPRAVARSLAEAGDVKRITVRINSPGGDVFDGMAIYNLLNSVDSAVRVEIHGLAASMASIIALAGDQVLMAEGSMFMVHNPWGMALGDADDMKKSATLLDKIKSNMLDIYMNHANVSREKMSELMDEETWLTPAEAIKIGFADGMVAQAVTYKLPESRFRATIEKFRNTPQHLLAVFAAKRETMDREALIAALGLKPNATDDEILAACKSVPSAGNMVPRADYEALRAEVEAERAQRERDKAAAFAASVDAAINDAVRSGKIPPVSADYHRRACMRGEEALQEFRAYVAAAPVIASEQPAPAPERAAAVAKSDEEKKVMRNLGLSAEQMAAARADIREDEDNYPHEAYRFAF